jgi:hypothetical protein
MLLLSVETGEVAERLRRRPALLARLLLVFETMGAFTGMLSVGDAPEQVTGELVSIVRALIRGLAP